MSIQTGPRCYLLLLVLAFLLLSPASTFAQVTGATLSGSITDPSGAVLVGAHIVIENMETGIARGAITNADGFYSAPNLAPGTYEVSISAAGFATKRNPSQVKNW